MKEAIIQAIIAPGVIGGILTMASTGYFPPQTTWSTTAAFDPGLSSPPSWWTPLRGIRTQRLFLMEYEGTQEFTDTILHPEALGEIVEWLNDEQLMQFSRHRGAIHTVDTQRRYLMDNYGGRELMKTYPRKYWLIFRCDEERDTKKDALIGTITRSIDSSLHHLWEPIVDIGILLGKEQGNGYALEAMSGLINWHSGKGFCSFRIGTDIRNEAMIKLATSCGMTKYEQSADIVYMRLNTRINSNNWTGR